MILDIVLVAAGVALLSVGGEAVVRGALATGTRLGVSSVFAGLVIVGFGTSAPELVVSVHASITGRAGIAVGNVVGSNIANVLLILGLSALLTPLFVERAVIKRDATTMIGASVLFVALILMTSGSLTRVHGAFLFALLMAYLVWAYRSESRITAAPDDTQSMRLPRTTATTLLFVIGGLGTLIAGSHLLITGAVGLADTLGVSESVVGLTVVAVGTSLPELAVCIVAVARRQSGLAVGNIVGSNIFNLLGILGVAALVSPLSMAPRIIHVDAWVMLAAAVVLTVFLLTGRRLARIEGALLLLAYIGYLLATFTVISA